MLLIHLTLCLIATAGIKTKPTASINGKGIKADILVCRTGMKFQMKFVIN
jgi:CTP synthase (UTP-ammonia lyase)